MKWFGKYVLSGAAVCAAAVGVISVQGVSAQNDSASMRIGVVNRKTVFDSYNTRKTEWSALESEKTKLQTEIDGLRETVNAAAKKLREDTTMTSEQRQQLAEKIDSDSRSYEDRWRRAQGDIDSKADKFFSRILNNIDTGVRTVGASDGCSVVFEADPKAGSPVLYFDPSLDMTNKVVTHLNSN
ncbi:MAG TPA: OmpH family outer membrane protein [Candidatus Hydrogenedentes bacterium]|nr:OmpH family outer membrane protein [Candidatus Hydrogenedentota bacterium]HRK33270.1 OmpH family outer membrane protein [Candidatus Hydrogenedentota bacterium]